MYVMSDFMKEHSPIYSIAQQTEPTIAPDTPFDLVDIELYPWLVSSVSGMISPYGESLRTPSSSRSDFAQTITTRES